MKHHNVAVKIIERKIFVIRGHRVMLDRDLAELYGVATSNLNKAVKRNLDRFPKDFMFQLHQEEYDNLRFQFGILRWGAHSKYLPHAFTQEGIAMLSSVLHSPRAVQVNIHIMRAFIRLKTLILSTEQLRRKIAAMERKYDKGFAIVFDAIDRLFDGPHKKFRVSGFDMPKRS